MPPRLQEALRRLPCRCHLTPHFMRTRFDRPASLPPQMPNVDNLYCKYTYEHSSDWKFMQVFSTTTEYGCNALAAHSVSHCCRTIFLPMIYQQGLDNGISQIARSADADQGFLFNYPVDITFKSYADFAYLLS